VSTVLRLTASRLFQQRSPRCRRSSPTSRFLRHIRHDKRPTSGPLGSAPDVLLFSSNHRFELDATSVVVCLGGLRCSYNLSAAVKSRRILAPATTRTCDWGILPTKPTRNPLQKWISGVRYRNVFWCGKYQCTGLIGERTKPPRSGE
jgi:hypothetical protein